MIGSLRLAGRRSAMCAVRCAVAFAACGVVLAGSYAGAAEATRTGAVADDTGAKERASPAQAQPATPSITMRPGKSGEDCLRCHRKIISRGHVHLALDGATCEDCHAPAGGRGRCGGRTSKSWKTTKKPAEICAECHDAVELVASLPAKHEPVLTGRCVECHDPHSSELPHLVRLGGNELCLRCHDARRPRAKRTVDLRRKVVHPALDGGDCSSCHAVAHGGRAPGFLSKTGADLCSDCHTVETKAKTVHAPVKKGQCTGCHDPHASDEPGLLKAPRARLCTTCHDPEKQVAKPIEHAPVVEGRCAGCHAAHTSSNEALLVEVGSKLCLRCHAKNAPSGKGSPGRDARVDLGRKVVHAAVGGGECQDCHVSKHSGDVDHLLVKPEAELCYGCHDRKDQKRNTHGAVRLGECTGCHDPHSAERTALLRGSSTDKMCFRCHQDDLRRRKVVHEPVKEGDCMACHDPHSADGRKLLTRGKRTCEECHGPVEKGSVRHLVVRRHGCNACHDAHGSANDMLLPKRTNALCAVCHPAEKDGGHIARSFGAKHAVEGALDPRREGRPFTCASCHDPHGSNHRFLFRSGDSVATMCDGCHGNISGKSPGGVDLVRRAKTQQKSAGTASPAKAGAGGGAPAPR